MGYVVASIDSAMPEFLRQLGAPWDGQIFHGPNQGVRVAFMTTRPQDAQVQLVGPAGDGSPVLRFLREKGGGLHHACYEVADLETQLAEFRSHGAIVAKHPIAAGQRVSCVMTKETNLIDFPDESASIVATEGEAVRV